MLPCIAEVPGDHRAPERGVPELGRVAQPPDLARRALPPGAPAPAHKADHHPGLLQGFVRGFQGRAKRPHLPEHHRAPGAADTDLRLPVRGRRRGAGHGAAAGLARAAALLWPEPREAGRPAGVHTTRPSGGGYHAVPRPRQLHRMDGGEEAGVPEHGTAVQAPSDRGGFRTGAGGCGGDGYDAHDRANRVRVFRGVRDLHGHDGLGRAVCGAAAEGGRYHADTPRSPALRDQG
mmetsp:Transcript_6859/g.13015  ORF Transcript_6859/g.13015 Transcript_6859/m.13015 type:complete len:234 (-) Transcript_6859:1704-2405(-)